MRCNIIPLHSLFEALALQKRKKYKLYKKGCLNVNCMRSFFRSSLGGDDSVYLIKERQRRARTRRKNKSDHFVFFFADVVQGIFFNNRCVLRPPSFGFFFFN